MRWFVLFVLGCGGSSSTPSPDAPPTEDLFVEQSGTRLVRRGHDVAGTPVLSQIFDTARGERCTPRGFGDGKMYCTPFENVVYAYYGDAACTQPVGVGQVVAPTAYVMRYADDDCLDTLAGLYRLGARLPQNTYYVQSGGECRGYTVADIEGVFALGAQVMPSELVEVTISDPVGTHRLRRRFVESADGLRMAHAYHDSELAADCYLSTHADEQAWTCIPARLGYTAFADATCVTPAVDGGRCEAPSYASELSQPSCPYPEITLYRVGAPIGTETYVANSGVCSLHRSDTRTYARGEQVTRVDGAWATVGDGRIQHVIARTEDDLSTGQLYDRELGTRCSVVKAADGSWRCQPQYLVAATMYRDAGCTQPVDVSRQYIGDEGCPARPPVKYAAKSIEVTPQSYALEMHVVTGIDAGPLYQGTPGSCTPAPSRYQYGTVGAALPPSAMAAAQPI